MNHRKPGFKLVAVVPCFNEGSHLALFIEQLARTITQITSNYEIILVNDGSTDETSIVVESLLEHFPLHYIELSRNFGKEAALMAGINHSDGDATLLIDADFQHPLEIIPKMAQLWFDDYDMVYGVIQSRDKEGWIKRFGAKIFYSLVNTSKVHIPSNAGDFRWLDKKVCVALNRLQERGRFMKGLYAWVGYKSIGIDFVPNPRLSGKSNFSAAGLFRLGMAGVTAFTNFPLRLWTILGLGISFLAIIYGAYVVLDTVIFGNSTSGWPTLTVSLMFFSGVQLISIGVLGEYIGRIFEETKARPLYLISSEVRSADFSKTTS
jgi:glycosyltransferase involved in cell wall biosynthesis